MRMALLRCMHYHTHGGGIMGKVARAVMPGKGGDEDPPPDNHLFGLLGNIKLGFTEFHRGKTSRISELMFFRESVRRFQKRWTSGTKARGDIGLPFLEYMEKSVSQTLGKLVRLKTKPKSLNPRP